MPSLSSFVKPLIAAVLASLGTYAATGKVSILPLLTYVGAAIVVELAHLLSQKLRASGQSAAADAVDALASDVSHAAGTNAPVTPVETPSA